MLKNPELLEKELIKFIKQSATQMKTKGVVVHLDGSLMSLVLVVLAGKLESPFDKEIVITSFSENKNYNRYLHGIMQEFKIEPSIRDLSQDYELLSPYHVAREDLNLEIAFKKRFTDLMLHIEADKRNFSVLGNLCLSQWLIEFPHKNYKNHNYLYPLSMLYYGEIQELASHLGIPSRYVEREPSHYLFRGQVDKELMGYTYQELETFHRDGEIKNTIDQEIQRDFKKDDREQYLCPRIQRPSNLLG